MHTTGEPTRIVYSGFPVLSGHNEMYGALLRPETELTKSSDAHIEVLFIGNDGFSTMCGHATIALGRFLVDTHTMKRSLPKRHELKHDPSTNTAMLNLHAPCGLLRVTCPTTSEGCRSDPSRPVSFVSVPSFATALQVEINIPHTRRWPELTSRESVLVDFSYGGAFYCMVDAAELGFQGGLRNLDFDAMNKATRLLKATVNSNADFREHFTHPDHQDLGHLYGVIVINDKLNLAAEGSSGAETGLCYFGVDQQIDRSPRGGGVAARVAVAYAKGRLAVGQSWTYNHILSNAFHGLGAFKGTIVCEVDDEECQSTPHKQTRVKIEGHAYYTGYHTFLSEDIDYISECGFVLEKLGG